MESLNSKIQEIKRLSKILNDASAAYYNGQDSGMTDTAWDSLFIKLAQLEQETGIVFSNSPTHHVGATILDKAAEVDLSTRPMLSLKKVHTDEEILDFFPGQLLIVMVKCDGLSVRLLYEGGNLVLASTRGDGTTGLNITEHVKRFTNVPLTIDYKESLVVDGEAIIYKDDFEMINKDGKFKNPRNLAAGTLNSLDTSLTIQRKLSFIAWDMYTLPNEQKYLTDRLVNLEHLGFAVVPWASSNRKPPDEVYDDNKWMMEVGACNIPCDGVVWRLDDITFGEAQGRTDHHYNYAIAWKPPIKTYVTQLKNIDWTMGRMGTLTPVAIFNPVDIDGATITRANLHNLDIMDKLLGQPYEGQFINIFKANEIIPQIESADLDPNHIDHRKIFITPKVCPICEGDTEVVTSEDGCHTLQCTNPHCEGKLANRIDHLLGKKGLDIKGISIATIEDLIAWGWVEKISDVFNLQQYRNEWVTAPGYGEKSVDNILTALTEGKTTTFVKFLPAIGIPLIGRTASKEICKHFKTYEDFKNAVNEKFDFSQFDNFSFGKTNSILNFDYTEADKIAAMLTFKAEEVAEAKPQTLEGKTICITGKLETYKNRDLFKADIEAAGGKVTGSVSGKTNILINNDTTSTSAKNLSAKKLGIPIYSEKQFIAEFLT